MNFRRNCPVFCLIFKLHLPSFSLDIVSGSQLENSPRTLTSFACPNQSIDASATSEFWSLSSRIFLISSIVNTFSSWSLEQPRNTFICSSSLNIGIVSISLRFSSNFEFDASIILSFLSKTASVDFRMLPDTLIASPINKFLSLSCNGVLPPFSTSWSIHTFRLSFWLEVKMFGTIFVGCDISLLIIVSCFPSMSNGSSGISVNPILSCNCSSSEDNSCF